MYARQFDRHITDIPFKFISGCMLGEHEESLKDFGEGGLCFRARGWLVPGTDMRISIPLSKYPCRTSGKVIWCRKADRGQYEMGIKFEETVNPLALNEITRIEHYKEDYFKTKGQRVTGNEAARKIGAVA